MAYTDEPTPIQCPSCGYPLRRRQRTHYPETDRLECTNCEYVRHLHLEEAAAITHITTVNTIREIARRQHQRHQLKIEA